METNQKKNKKLFIIIGAIVILCVLAVAIMVAVGGNSGEKLSKQLDLGEKYLSELDYESAIAAYEAAIKIDPKAEDAYLGLAETYIAMGDLDKALEVLQTGYEEIGSDAIKEMEEEIRERIEVMQAEAEESSTASEPVEQEIEQEETGIVFVPWEEVGLEDHVMDWQDENLENAMKVITGITDRKIMLSDVWEITHFAPSEMGIGNISNISALGALKNLTYLNLSCSEISDISALGGLTNLEYLDLSDNNISDVSELSGLINLKDLYLWGNPIEDFSAVSFVPNLEID